MIHKLELSDKNFKIAILSMLNKLEEKMNKTDKKSTSVGKFKSRKRIKWAFRNAS